MSVRCETWRKNNVSQKTERYLKKVGMYMWFKLLEIAQKLNVSKDVVKYHRKSLPEETIKKVDGEVYISEEGMELIRLKLKKDTYHENFEQYVRQSLRKLDQRLDMVNHLLLEKAPNLTQSVFLPKEDKELISSLDTILISPSFQEWYDGKVEDVTVVELKEYLEFKHSLL